MKFGTPIGAGPKGAIVVVGLPRVGAPPLPNWAPPSPSPPSAWSPPPFAPGALTPPPVPLELLSPRSLLWVTPPLTSSASAASSSEPCSTSPPPSLLFLLLSGEEVVLTPALGASSVSLGSVQSGSSASISWSPSSSTPLPQAGGEGGGQGRSCRRGRHRGAVGERVGAGDRGAQRGHRQEAGERDDQCDLVSHPSAPHYPCPPSRNAAAAAGPSPDDGHGHATRSPRGAQRLWPPPNMPLISSRFMPAPAAFQPNRMRSLSCRKRDAKGEARRR